jgi:hypothetical protein
MRRERHHRGLATLAVIGLLGVAGCSDGADGASSTDEATSTTMSSTSTTSISSTTVPGSTTSVLPPCSEVTDGRTVVTPARWLPAEVPAGWRLEAAATVPAIGAPATPDATQFVLLDGTTVAGVVAMGTGAVRLEQSEPITVRGTAGAYGYLGGRSQRAANPFVVWREDGVDRWATAAGLERAAVLDALTPVELAGDSVRLTDPTGRLVQVAERPSEPASALVVLAYEVAGGTATSPLGAGTAGGDTPGGGTAGAGGARTDRVLVLIEQFGPGGSGILVDSTGALGQSVGWELGTVDGRLVLRTPDEAEIPVISGAATVVDEPETNVAVSIIGAPSNADTDADTDTDTDTDTDAAMVLTAVTRVAPSDGRLATARVDVGERGEIDVAACLPDGDA